MKNVHPKTRWLTRTAVLIALLLALQWVTAGTQVFAGQYITGSLVNCVLAVAALLGGISCGVVVAVLSPLFAFLLGIGPKVFPIIPCIAIGNMVFVVVFAAVANQKLWRRILAVIVSAFAKFATLYIAVVQVFIPLFEDNLKAPQVQTFTAMFSWPQLVTALLGGALATILTPVLYKAIKNRDDEK